MRPPLMLAAAAIVAALAAGACGERERRCECPADRGADERLMLLLSTARAYHHQADLQLRQGEVDAAIQTVRRILALEADPRLPEAEEVRLDATARLGKLLLGKGETDEALRVVERGLAGVGRDSFYLSNLHGVRGEVLEKRAAALEGAGRKEEARAVAREAISAYERSIAINKRLEEKLGGGGRR
jgi:tetratricopeptide (TPR) repeat protein